MPEQYRKAILYLKRMVCIAFCPVLLSDAPGSLRIAMDGLDNKGVLVYELIIPDFESSRSKELKKEEGMSTEPCLYQVGKQVCTL